MIVQFIYHPDGLTLTIKPQKYRDRFPKDYKLSKDDATNCWYIKAPGQDRLNLGPIPDDYKLVSKDKYEIVLSTENRRKIKPRKKRTARP